MPNSAIRWIAVGAAVVLAPAAAIHARAEKASERRSMDLLEDRFVRDREEDSKGPKLSPEQKLVAEYGEGTTALDQWAPLLKIMRDKQAGATLRDKVVTAFIRRMGVEFKRGTDNGDISATKKQIALEALPLIVNGDKTGQRCIHRLLSSWWGNSRIDTRPGQPKRARNRAYNAWRRILKD